MKDMYLVSCEGQGDTQCIIVDKEAWDYLHSDAPTFVDNSATEIPPLGVRQAILMESQNSIYKSSGDPKTIEGVVIWVTSGSYINDRALAMRSSIINGNTVDFIDMQDAKQFVIDNNINIVDEYEGYIY